MKHKNFHFQEDARRRMEIEQYGRILSLRPSVAHKSKKKYDRKVMKKEVRNELRASYFLF